MQERPWRRTYEKLIGKNFGRLSVLSLDRTGKDPVFLVKCSCGNQLSVLCSSVANSHTKSCGCLHKEATRAAKTIHGCSPKKGERTPEYKAWLGMRRRCGAREGSKDFPIYAGRGISICERWNDFKAFFSDVGPKPNPEYSLDRICNDGNYEPGNVRWASKEQQARNKRTNRFTQALVDSMRSLHKSGASPSEICALGNCSYRTMRNIVTYKIWK